MKKRSKKYKRIRAVVVLISILITLIFLGKYLKGRVTKEGMFPEEVGGVPIYTEILPEGSPGRPGTIRRIKYIVIHETANKDKGADAKSHSEFLQSGNSGTTSWHYTVDDREIYHHIPDNEVAWQAGEKYGNLHGIGVELCINSDGNFEKTFDNGAKLTAYLLKAYNLKIKDIKQHGDFIAKNCPENIRDSGRWDEFLEKVKIYYKQ